MDNKTLRTLKEQSKINEFERIHEEKIQEQAELTEMKLRSKLEGYVEDVLSAVDAEVLEKVDLLDLANDIWECIEGWR